jgi:hypothetical protein
MNTTQFIILSILFLAGLFCQMYNLWIELKKNNVTKVSFLLQTGAIICLTVVYGLGVIATFAGVYKT